MDRTGANVLAAAKSVGTIHRGEWSLSRTVMPAEGRRGVFQEEAAAGKSERKRGGQGELRFRGSKGDQGRK